MNLGLRLTLNTAAQLIGKVLTTGTTLLVTLLITRQLKEEGYGEFTAITSFVALFYLAVDFGINAIFVRELSEKEEKIPSYFRNLLLLRLVISLMAIFIALALLSFLPYPSLVKLGIIIGSLTILNQALSVSTNAIFQLKLRYDHTVIAEFFASCAIIALAFLTLKTTNNILPVMIAYVLGGMVRVAVSFFLTSRYTQGIGFKRDNAVWKALFLPSIPLGIVAIFSQIVGNIDKVIIALIPFNTSLGISNIAAVGVYGLAYKIFEVVLVFPTFVMNAAFPMMVKKKEENIEHLKRFSMKLGFILLFLGFAGAAFVYLTAPLVISLFKGESDKFNLSISVLQVLGVSLPIFFVSALTLWLTITLGKQRLLIFVYGFAALMNFVLNFHLVPTFGYMASAILTIVTEVFILTSTLLITMTAFREKQALK